MRARFFGILTLLAALTLAAPSDAAVKFKHKKGSHKFTAVSGNASSNYVDYVVTKKTHAVYAIEICASPLVTFGIHIVNNFIRFREQASQEDAGHAGGDLAKVIDPDEWGGKLRLATGPRCPRTISSLLSRSATIM